MSIVLAELGGVELSRNSDNALHAISVSRIPRCGGTSAAPPIAAGGAAFAMFVAERLSGRPMLQTSFNVAVTGASVGLAAQVADCLGLSGSRLGNGNWCQMGELLGVVFTYYMSNTLPVVGLGARVRGRHSGA